MLKRRVLITGSTGFLGSRILSRIRKEADKVYCLTRRCPDVTEDGNITRLQCDLSAVTEEQADHIRKSLDGLTDVIHVAGQMPNPDNRNDFELFYKQNCMVSLHLAGLLPGSVKWICFISTVDVYKHSDNSVISEESPLEPLTYYASSKLAAEDFFRVFSRRHDIKLAVLRPSQMYGPGDSCPHKFIPSAMRGAVSDGVIRICGDGEDRRDYLYVEDAAEVVGSAYRKRAGGKFNIATGQSYSISEAAELIREIANPDAAIEFADSRKAKTCCRYDISKIRTELSTVPKTKLQDGLSLTQEALSAAVY